MNLIKLPFFFYWAMVNRIFFKVKKVRCYTSMYNIKGLVRVYGRGEIMISKGVKLNSGMPFNPIGGDDKLRFICAEGACLWIGESSGLSNCCIVARKSVKIGSNVKIGGNVKIYDTDFHAIDYLKRRSGELDKENTVSKAIVIENDVFIGAHSIILKGVKIGTSSVIGAGSLISKDIPAFEVWAGNPARFIKKIN